jgi:quercetin dioxygenase-like cupin family protein
MDNLSYVAGILMAKETKEVPMRLRVPLSIAVVLIAGFALAQQSAQQPVIANPEEAKFVSSPAVPDCYSYALERGDPKGSGSVTLVKMSSGCVVPTHWHSANEQVTITSGTGQIQMKGEQPQTVSAGTYIYVPANHVHQFTCKDSCTFYRTVDGPVDIHYVDAGGNELPAATALAAVGERPGAPVAAQK